MLKTSLKLIAFLPVISAITSCTPHAASYVEPSQDNANAAFVKLENENIVTSIVGAAILKPDNLIGFNSIDGMRPSFFSSDTIRINPGRHQIVVFCALNGSSYDSKTFTINALPKRVYTISFPKNLNMHGYTVDYNACKQLIIK